LLTGAILGSQTEVSEATFVRHHKDLPKEGIFKTHCWAPSRLCSDTKYVYVYGDFALSAISAHQQPEDFQRLHYLNMGAAYEDRENWPWVDTLHILQNFRSWQTYQKFVLFLKYDELWSPHVREALDTHLGFPVILPEKKQRATLFDCTDVNHFAAQMTYQL
jgi:hypothetical protein